MITGLEVQLQGHSVPYMYIDAITPAERELYKEEIIESIKGINALLLKLSERYVNSHDIYSYSCLTQ